LSQALRHFGPPLWDAARDRVCTVDRERARSELAGTAVRFAIGAADAESAAEGSVPFKQLSAISLEMAPIPDIRSTTRQ